VPPTAVLDIDSRLLCPTPIRGPRSGRPEVGTIAHVDHANYRNRHFRKLSTTAGIGAAMKADGTSRHRTPKDLRDTFASQLLTAGVQLGYMSRQLGHSDVSVTARHYARWAGATAIAARSRWVRTRCPPTCSPAWPRSPHTAAEARKGNRPEPQGFGAANW
jgi:integrase